MKTEQQIKDEIEHLKYMIKTKAFCLFSDEDLNLKIDTLEWVLKEEE